MSAGKVNTILTQSTSTHDLGLKGIFQINKMLLNFNNRRREYKILHKIFGDIVKILNYPLLFIKTWETKHA